MGEFELLFGLLLLFAFVVTEIHIKIVAIQDKKDNIFLVRNER